MAKEVEQVNSFSVMEKALLEIGKIPLRKEKVSSTELTELLF